MHRLVDEFGVTAALSPSTLTSLKNHMRSHSAYPKSEFAVLACYGTGASIVIALASAARGWPFPSLTAHPWIYQLDTSNDVFRYVLLACLYAAVATLCWCWVRCLKAARNSSLTPRSIIALLALWAAPLCISMPLFSGDVYVYGVDGEALARGFSPYEAGIASMGPEPSVYMVHPLWRNSLTMYGPLFMRMAEAIAIATDGAVIAAVLMFRAVAVLSVAVIAWSIWRICKALGKSITEGLAFALLNPITVLHLIGGAHNDATMLALFMAGIAVGVTARSWPLRVTAVFLCASGAAFKVPAFAGILLLGWMWAGANASITRRLTTSAAWATFGVGALQIIGMVTQLGWGWTKATDVPGLAHPLFAPANALATALGWPFGVQAGLNDVTRIAASLLAVGLAAFLVIRTGRSGSTASVLSAGGWALLALAWLGPALYPWYLAWGVVLLGSIGVSKLRNHLVVMCIVASFVVAPSGHGWLDTWSDWRRNVVATVAAGVVIWTAWSVSKKTRSPDFNDGSSSPSSVLQTTISHNQ